MDAVRNAVQNGIEQLSGQAVATNSHPGDPYRFKPRNREELLASQAEAHMAGAADPVEQPPAPPPPAKKGWTL